VGRKNRPLDVHRPNQLFAHDLLTQSVQSSLVSLGNGDEVAGIRLNIDEETETIEIVEDE
jgi:hypothetical protein